MSKELAGWFCGAVWVIAMAASGTLSASPRPNIVWLSCEDIGPHLGCYGTPEAVTPHLDRLAARGARYTRAFAVAGVCAPCRASIITGMYASTLGNQFMRCSADLPDHARLFPQYLRDAGYYCTNNSKTDYNITGDHKRCWDESSPRAHWRNRPSREQPFFAVFNFTVTHESQVFGYKRREELSADQLHDAAAVTPPPYHPDTPVVRQDWAHYHDNITLMDQQAGRILQQLEEDGLTESTIVLFWSDHGAGLPRSKRWLYDSGIHVPLIVRIPEAFRDRGQAEAGSVQTELVSLLDLAPTMLHLAGLPIPVHFQGRAFLGKDLSPRRRYIHAIRDRMDERYDMVRAVRDHRYKYLRNFYPDRPYAQILNYMEQEHTMQELRRLHDAGRLPVSCQAFMTRRKPLEELYDLDSDPHEMVNLIDQAEHNLELRRVLEEMRGELRRWMLESRDTGLIPEAELIQRADAAGTRYDVLRQPAGPQLLDELLQASAQIWSPQTTGDQLLQLLEHADAAVRYWAVVALADRVAEMPAADLRGARQAVLAALEDPSASVRVQAARAAWRIGETDRALPVLVAAVRADEEFLSLAAMHVLDEMDADALPVWDVIGWVRKHGKPYPKRIATWMEEEPQHKG